MGDAAKIARPREDGAITIRVRVKPNARSSALEAASDGVWIARVKSPPRDGKANAELLALVARHFRCRPSEVSIQSGAAGRLKLVRVQPSETARGRR